MANWEKVFHRVNWENEPSTATPIDEDNLNRGDNALDIIDERVVELGARTTSLEGYETRVALLEQEARESKEIAVESAQSATESKNKAKEYMDTAEGFKDETQGIKDSALTEVAGAKSEALDAISADRQEALNAIATDKADAQSAIATDKADAQSAIATDKAEALGAIVDEKTDALDEMDEFAKLSESYAHGKTNTRAGEDTDNSEYYSQESKKYMEQAKALVDVGFASDTHSGLAKGDGTTIHADADNGGRMSLTEKYANHPDESMFDNKVHGLLYNSEKESLFITNPITGEEIEVAGGGAGGSVLEVTAPSGSHITVSGAGRVYEGDGGVVSFKLRDYGTYTILASKGKQKATRVIEITESRLYKESLTYWQATIRFNSEHSVDAVVSPIEMADIVHDWTKSEKYYEINVYEPNDYSITGSYTIHTHNMPTWNVSKTVTVTEQKTYEESAFEFPRADVEVTFPEGATCTITKGELAYTATGNPYTFILPSLGTWEIKAMQGEKSIAKSIEVEDKQTYEEEVHFFRAFIDATYPVGSQITCTKGTTVYEGDTSGRYRFQVDSIGNWKVKITDGEQVSEQIVEITHDDQEEVLTIAYFTATIDVTIKATGLDEEINAEITAEKGGVVQTRATGSSASLIVSSTGTYTIRVKDEHHESTTTVIIDTEGQRESTAFGFFFGKITASGACGKQGVDVTIGEQTFSQEQGEDSYSFECPVYKQGSYDVSVTGKTTSETLQESKGVMVGNAEAEVTLDLFTSVLNITYPEGSDLTVSPETYHEGLTYYAWSDTPITFTISDGEETSPYTYTPVRGETKDIELTYVPRKSFSECTDEELVRMVEASNAGKIDLSEYWAVGQERTVHLNAISGGIGDAVEEQDMTFVLMNKGGKAYTDGGECAFIMGMKNCSNQGVANFDATNVGGWGSSRVYRWLNEEILGFYKSAFPEHLRGIIKKFKYVISNGGTKKTETATGLNTVEVYFGFPVEMEVLGARTYSPTDEAEYYGAGGQFEWYKTPANRIKKQGISGDSTWWWTSSSGTYYDAHTSYCCIDEGGRYGDIYTAYPRGISPYTCLGTSPFSSCSLTVTYPAGAECTITQGSTTYTATSNPHTFTGLRGGEWVAKITKSGENPAEKSVILLEREPSKSVELDFAPAPVSFDADATALRAILDYCDEKQSFDYAINSCGWTQGDLREESITNDGTYYSGTGNVSCRIRIIYIDSKRLVLGTGRTSTVNKTIGNWVNALNLPLKSANSSPVIEYFNAHLLSNLQNVYDLGHYSVMANRIKANLVTTTANRAWSLGYKNSSGYYPYVETDGTIPAKSSSSFSISFAPHSETKY